MYLYDTRYDKESIERFPIEGWFFPCYHCSLISSNKITKPYERKIIYFPVCKKCIDCKILYNNIKNIQIKYISQKRYKLYLPKCFK